MTGQQMESCIAFVDQLNNDCHDAIAALDPVSAAEVHTLFTMAVDRCYEPEACWAILSAIRAKVGAGPVVMQ